MLPSATPSRCPQRPLSRGESSFFSLPCALSARGPSAHGGACPRRARGLCRDRNATMRNTVASGTDRQRASGAHTARTAPRTHTLRASGGAGNARHSFGADCLRSPTSYIRRPALRAQALSTLSAHRAPWLGAGCACFLSVGDMTGIRVQRISGSCPQSNDKRAILWGHNPELPSAIQVMSPNCRAALRPILLLRLFRSRTSDGSAARRSRETYFVPGHPAGPPSIFDGYGSPASERPVPSLCRPGRPGLSYFVPGPPAGPHPCAGCGTDTSESAAIQVRSREILR